MTGPDTAGGEESPARNQMGGDNSGNALQADQIHGGVNARSTNVNSRSMTINLPAVGVMIGVLLTLTAFVVWSATGSKNTSETPPAAPPIMPTQPAPAANSTAAQPNKAGQCIEQHLDTNPAVLQPARYQLPVGVQANVMTGTHYAPIAGILVHNGQTVGAIRLFYEANGTGLQILEVVDASCATVQYSPPQRVGKSDYTTTFQIAGQPYEVAITASTAIFLDITFRLA